MTVFDVLLTGVALSMDAVAVGMANGMAEPRMKTKKMLLIAAFYGFFQFFMPLLGYAGSAAFVVLVERIAPWLSCALLCLIGGKMLAEQLKEERKRSFPHGKGMLLSERRELGLGRLFGQAVATSVDALAVGVSMLAQETSNGLPFSAPGCAAVIGALTFLLSFAAVSLGKAAGGRLSDQAEVVGGLILLFIGGKLLIEGI